jgi:rod shape-determining protein MreC
MVWKKFSHFRRIFFIATLISIPLLLLYAQRRVPGFQRALASPVVDGSLMLQSGFSSMVGFVTDRLYALSAAFDSHDELVQLRAKVDEAKDLKLTLLEVQIENLRLKELLDFSSQFSLGRSIGSNVIGRTGSPLSRTLQIDKGVDQGIRRGDAVISASGAVGQVLMTGSNYSEILLLTDSSSAVDVVVQRTRARGLLKGLSGSSSYRMHVHDFDRLHEVREGDVVVTSGMGARFPPGVPVGEITSVKQMSDSLYVEAEVKPFTHFDSLEQVVILADGGLQKPWRRDELVMEKLEISPANIAAKRK